MTPTLNSNLQIPYEIGKYIASLTPGIDKPDSWHRDWAMHDFHFQAGPDPSCHQLKRGLVLEVSTAEKKPQALHTKYGYWKVLGASHGSFDKIFATLQKTLHLKKIEGYKHPYLSLWAIQTWKDKELPMPVRAFQKGGEYIPHHKAVEAYKEFKNHLSILNQKKLDSGNSPENSSKNPTSLVSRVTPSLSNAPEKKPCESKTPPSNPAPSIPTNSEKNTSAPLPPPSPNTPPPSDLAEAFPVLPRPPSYRPPTSSTPSVVRKKVFNAVSSQPRNDTKKAEPTILMDQRLIMSKSPATPGETPTKIGQLSLERFAPKLPFQSTPTVPIKILQRQKPKTPIPSIRSDKVVNTSPQRMMPKVRILTPLTPIPPVSNKRSDSLSLLPAKKALTIETPESSEYSLFTLDSDKAHEQDIENTSPEGWQPLFHSPFNGLRATEIYP